MKIKMMIMLLIVSMIFVSCSTVEAGYVGIKVYLLGTKKGVDREVLPVGRYWIGMNQQLYTYPTFLNTYPFTQAKSEGDQLDEAFYFQSKEGVKCNVDVAVQCKADATKVSDLFQAYRLDMSSIIKTYMRNDLRNLVIKYASTLTIEQLYGQEKITLLKNVEGGLKELYASKGIIIENISFLSDIRFPNEIQESIVAKIQATQKAMQSENELREAQAEAKKKIAIAMGDAESNRVKQVSLSAGLLEYERIMNERQAIAKWNGVSPLYTNGSIIPFTNVK